MPETRTVGQIIDGKTIAEDARRQVAIEVANLGGLQPGLATVVVGDDPASHVYVRNKQRAAAEVGILGHEYALPETTSERSVISLIDQLNENPAVHGILIQLPLPAHISAQAVLERVRPDKDVDGFHPMNVGRLSAGLPALVPCTPRGCMTLIHTVRANLQGCHAVVIGRSNIVGKPMAQLLLQADCTVVMTHRYSVDVEAECRRADIVVAAVGRPSLVRGHWIKPGAIVIDVGINRVPGPDGKGARLVGDVAFDEAITVAGAITPVPGGVGPMTIATLLSNTVQAAHLQQSL